MLGKDFGQDGLVCDVDPKVLLSRCGVNLFFGLANSANFPAKCSALLLQGFSPP